MKYNSIFQCKNKLEFINKINSESHKIKDGQITLNCPNLFLNIKDINEISKAIYPVKIDKIISDKRETIISASSLKIKSEFKMKNKIQTYKYSDFADLEELVDKFHIGTIRSGQEITSDKNLIIIGNVNPGAKVSAVSNIFVWGKLLGIAHAGIQGKTDSKISAIFMKPLQLRIAGKIAIGPSGYPKPYTAEEAKIISGKIIIEPINFETE
tara:strand:+ start:5975 stop:6607 length:633 start_codon:yes stop_codon:yes gene_type:complete